jgi:TctA family transporter
MKPQNLNQFVLAVIASINVVATVFVALNLNEDRENKLWQLYTVSTTGLYGFVIASNRITGDE